MDRDHSSLPPSGAGIWIHCAAFRAMVAAFPETEPKPAAAEGVAAHWVMEQVFDGVEPEEGARAPNGELVTADMLDGAQLIVDDVVGTLSEASFHVEFPVRIPSVHADCWGTPDVRTYLPAARMLYVWDYKFGHDPVDAFENWQLICYAAGILDEIGANGLDDQAIRVVMRIVQPRSFHRDGPVREWSVRASDLRSYINRLRVAAHTPTTAAKVNPGCKYCPGRHACPELQRAAWESAELAREISGPYPLEPTPAAIELYWLSHARDRLNARITGLEEQLTATAIRGTQIPGYRLAPGQGRTVWSVPTSQVIAMGQMFGLSLAKPPAPVTPAQARKAGLPEEVAASMSERQRGAVTLVRDDGSDARKIFSRRY